MTQRVLFLLDVQMAAQLGEPKQVSGKQERYENLLNQYLLR